MSFSNSTIRNDLSLPLELAPSEWADTDTDTDIDTQMIAYDGEELLSAISFQWISDGQHKPYQHSHRNNISHDVTPCDSSSSSSSLSVEQDDVDLACLMEVDEPIGENLLGDEVFASGCGTGERFNFG